MDYQPDKLAIERLNRLQNHLVILMADASTGKTKLFIPRIINITLI